MNICIVNLNKIGWKHRNLFKNNNNFLIEKSFVSFLYMSQPNIPFYKIIIIGDTCVGKTSIINKYVDDTFTDHIPQTIGVEYKTKNIIIDSSEYKLQIYDTAGQEIFKSITSSYYRIADGVIVAFDLTNETSFNNVPQWIKDFIEAYEQKPMIIVGNKYDESEKRKVDQETAQKFATSQKIAYYETSAKTGQFIEDSFTKLAELIHKNSINAKKGVDIEKEANKKECC